MRRSLLDEPGDQHAEPDAAEEGHGDGHEALVRVKGHVLARFGGPKARAACGEGVAFFLLVSISPTDPNKGAVST